MIPGKNPTKKGASTESDRSVTLSKEIFSFVHHTRTRAFVFSIICYVFQPIWTGFCEQWFVMNKLKTMVIYNSYKIKPVFINAGILCFLRSICRIRVCPTSSICSQITGTNIFKQGFYLAQTNSRIHNINWDLLKTYFRIIWTLFLEYLVWWYEEWDSVFHPLIVCKCKCCEFIKR